MARRITILEIICLIAACGPVSMAFEESPYAYEIVAGASLPLLPAPLGDFFTAHREAFQKAAIAASAPAFSKDSPGKEARRHYVMLDVAANGDVHGFPRRRAEARQLFRQHGVQDGGELPWVLLEQARLLLQTSSLAFYVHRRVKYG